ncbi:MAG TPA: GDYXXLXY domain-containing protein [Beijerinckiaceae bacterium]|nr:GDYXXLXY domain-containing protein [Beijerinckiaceae bacterium]
MNAPGQLEAHLPRFHRIVQLSGAALLGGGLMLWIAANWDSIGKLQKFWLVGGILLAFGAIGATLAAWRTPAALGAFLAIGALFALFGQTYQTGADPWQLFALWAALGLPLAIAARHDAVFVPWMVVAFAALHLFVASNSAFFAHPTLGLLLPIWSGGFAIVAVLYGFNRSPWGENSARWAVQLGALVLASLIGGVAGAAIFDRIQGATVYWLGTLVVCGLILLCAVLKPREYVAMAIFTLTLDVLLIFQLGYSVAMRSSGIADGMLVVAMGAAIIVAASGWFLIKMAPFKHSDAPRTAIAAPVRDVDHDTKVTWPAAIVSGIGALIAAIPFYIFLGMTFYWFLTVGPAVLALGLVMIGAALFGLRAARRLGFLQQFAFIALMTGLGLCAFGIIETFDTARLRNVGLSLVLMAGLCGGVAILNRVGWISAILGACAAACIGGAIWSEIGMRKLVEPVTAGSASAVALALVLAFAQVLWSQGQSKSAESAMLSLRRFLTGATALALAALMGTAGPTFMSMAFSPVGGSNAIPELQTGWRILQGLSALCAAGGCALALKRFDAVGAPLALVVSAVTVAFAAFSPNLGPTVLLGSVLLTGGARGLAVLAAIAALWIAGTFYYWLGWPLVNKAYLLAALGLALVAAALALSPQDDMAEQGAGTRGWLHPVLAAVLLLAGPLAASGITLAGIRDNENVIATGRKIYLRTAPRDPRSLVQGDFMALNFEGGRMSNPLSATEKELYARADVDARGIAIPKAFSESPEKPGSGEIVFPLRWKGGRWIVVTDAWYFKEGTGQRFANARFGEFRLRGDGRMLLVGLADGDLKPLQ